MSEGGVLTRDLTDKEHFYIKMWERFKIIGIKPWEWLTNGVIMEEHMNAIIEMEKLHNKKQKMDHDLAEAKRRSSQGTSVSKGF